VKVAERIISLKILRLHSDDLPLPQYLTEGSVGMDLPAAIEKSLVILPDERAIIPTGLAVAIPEGYEAQIRPRSGMALKHGIILPNAPGTIDSDYRGEIQVIIANISKEPFTINRGDRIAQMVICPVVKAKLEICASLPETSRGSGGFGHTG